jgi:hypothetical protein
MAIGIGSHADITLLNVTITAINPDGTWGQIQMPAGADGTTPNIWLPIDSRINVATIQPPSWPPVEGDIWTAGGATAWVVAYEGVMYFVQESDIISKATPITTDAALVIFGNAMTLLYRKA